jgi:vacuolar-type H+-ATPase subunit H
MQEVREAKERALAAINEARMKKDEGETKVRDQIENRRDYLQRKKLEAALNTRRDWESTIGSEKQKARQMKIDV